MSFGGRRISVNSKSESCTGRMSSSRSFTSSLSPRSRNSPSRFVFGANRKVLTKSPSAFSANELRTGFFNKDGSSSQRTRSHSRMRAPQNGGRSTDASTDEDSLGCERKYRIESYRNKCANGFDQRELDSFFEWLMERENQPVRQLQQMCENDHKKRIEQIRSLLFR
ncbi:hypothetical protein Tcan_15191 [Toxocara canis]|uniref:Uncharacterized protein n=1 Tax=Toxocara canis TaxID=6265 RepID=A0A0B2UQT3_TOXCA|nr:hypothetical protein Tcan_15191 [Toxocara canis]